MFPLTLTLHSSEQLHAVLCALQPLLDAQAQVLAKGAEPAAEVAAAPVEKPQSRSETKRAQALKASAPGPAEPTSPPAPTSPTAGAAAAAAPEKTAAACDPTAAPAAAEPPPSTAAAEPVAYDAVKQRINALAKTHREHVIDTLSAFGVRTGQNLKVEQYAAFLAALNQLPEEVTA
ncbi:hypothetical protein [Aquariibacter albus]|uniref:Uncharacterized protein n=1 Tax=Aquariibacter albus TaxID=2759899 RepID=A0A839HPI3_9BURK|nr:hypothetical protein [Aquariibacter albus]MBB1161498.1 hypothetical protein [Aquariibacter albus]